MSNFFKGVITRKDDGKLVVKVEEDKTKKLFELENELNFLIEDESQLTLSEGDEVLFSVNKKIYSDKTEIFAKIHKVLTAGWNQIYKDLIKKSNIFSLYEYHSYLESNYTLPQLKNYGLE